MPRSGLGGEYETLLGAFDKENEVFKKRVGKDRVRGCLCGEGYGQETAWRASIRVTLQAKHISMPELRARLHQGVRRVPSNEAGSYNGSIWEKTAVAERCGKAWRTLTDSIQRNRLPSSI